MADPRIASRLREMPLFADLRPKELALLALVMQDVTFSAGQVIFRQGEAADSCFFLLSGYVDVRSEEAAENASHLATLGPGKIFGQIALVDEDPRSATCVARTNGEALQLSKDDFDMLFSSGSQFAYRFQGVIALTAVEQLRHANYTLNQLLGPIEDGDDPVARVQRILGGQ